MDANTLLTINSFRQLFPDKIFCLTLLWFLVKSLTFPGQLSNSLTFPGFPDKWSPWIYGSSITQCTDYQASRRRCLSGCTEACPPISTGSRKLLSSVWTERWDDDGTFNTCWLSPVTNDTSLPDGPWSLPGWPWLQPTNMLHSEEHTSLIHRDCGNKLATHL